jgi:hypothetical protein
VCLYVCDQETPKTEAKGPSWTISACECEYTINDMAICHGYALSPWNKNRLSHLRKVTAGTLRNPETDIQESCVTLSTP